jgi:hypothetical protein
MEPRTIRVRCATWDQVEAFYADKLRGNILVVKMPFKPGIGEPMTVALSLPDGLVFAIDGAVIKIGPLDEEAGRVPVAVRLHGMTTEVRVQLRKLVAQARGQPVTPVQGSRAVGTRPPSVGKAAMPETIPPPSEPRFDEVPEDERGAWTALAGLRERVLALPAHEVLGVPADADATRAHSAYLALALRVHPDRFRRYRSRSMRALAADTFMHLRRAYQRVVPEAVAAAALERGWLLELGDGSEPLREELNVEAIPLEAMSASGSSPYSELSITRGASASTSYDDDVSFTTSVRMRALTAEELFDDEPTNAAPSPSASPAAIAARASQVVLGATVDVRPAPAGPGSDEKPAEDERSQLEASGRAALAESRWRDACEAFAAFLRLEPKNRSVRALYHVANGMDLRAKGEGVKARLQFETALAHDRDCEPARRALLPEGAGDRKHGLFKRLFDK